MSTHAEQLVGQQDAQMAAHPAEQPAVAHAAPHEPLPGTTLAPPEHAERLVGQQDMEIVAHPAEQPAVAHAAPHEPLPGTTLAPPEHAQQLVGQQNTQMVALRASLISTPPGRMLVTLTKPPPVRPRTKTTYALHAEQPSNPLGELPVTSIQPPPARSLKSLFGDQYETLFAWHDDIVPAAPSAGNPSYDPKKLLGPWGDSVEDCLESERDRALPKPCRLPFSSRFCSRSLEAFDDVASNEPIKHSVCESVKTLVAGLAPVDPPIRRSHWDRLSVELKDKIVGHVSPKIAGVLNRLRDIDIVSAMPWPTCDSWLWIDIIKYEPSFDLRRLDARGLNESAIITIKSREMLKRIKECIPVDPVLTQRLAFRNGWADLLKFRDFAVLAKAAAAEGAVDVLKILFWSRKNVRHVDEYVLCAASGGHLEAVAWLRNLKNANVQTSETFVAAVSSGNLELVTMLCSRGFRYNTDPAVALAASNGHTRVVKLLVDSYGIDNRGFYVDDTSLFSSENGHRDEAFVSAYQNGHTDVLKVLHARFPKRISSISERRFWFPRHLDTVMWLVKHRPSLDLKVLLHSAIFSGGVDMFRWLVVKIRCYVQPHMLKTALKARNLPLVEWMVTALHLKIDPSMIVCDPPRRNAVTSSQTMMTIFGNARNGANRPAAQRWGAMIEWIQRRFPGCITQSALEVAIRAKSDDSINSILRLHEVDQWDYDRIKQVALEFGDDSLLKRINDRFFGHLPPHLRPR
ncbi:hypothetical protein HK105_208969 [Polyrhizophydium stewartii]|uniref:Ankyrin repeat protein n=2 Tax=Polyrhizophydium stewartii TaxID=2732419 RepID=A0ABR4MWD4_9FUNG